MSRTVLLVLGAGVIAAGVLGSKLLENHTAGVPAETQASQAVKYGGIGLGSLLSVYAFARGRR